MARYTGFTDVVKQIIVARSSGMCEVMEPGCTQFGQQIHHRRPRGIGGTRRESTNQPSNGLMTCQACHTRIESHRATAVKRGWLVTQHANPRTTSIVWRGKHHFLDDHGGFAPPTEMGETA